MDKQVPHRQVMILSLWCQFSHHWWFEELCITAWWAKGYTSQDKSRHFCLGFDKSGWATCACGWLPWLVLGWKFWLCSPGILRHVVPKIEVLSRPKHAVNTSVFSNEITRLPLNGHPFPAAPVQGACKGNHTMRHHCQHVPSIRLQGLLFVMCVGMKRWPKATACRSHWLPPPLFLKDRFEGEVSQKSFSYPSLE